MARTRKRQTIEEARYQRWPEAEIIAPPISSKQLEEPRLLVQRRHSDICGPNGEEIAFFDGDPVISLFTGCGGMDIGVEQAGMTTVCQVEWDCNACQTLLGNRPNWFRNAALIQADVRTLTTERILLEAGLRVGEPAVVCGGPPCQGFSTSNSKSHHGTYDQRNDLVFEFLRIVREAKPKFFIFENVPGFVRFNKGEYFRLFLETAFGDFYELVYGLVDAVEYGVPQHRCRFLCMGTRRDVYAIEGCLAAMPKPQCFAESDLVVVSDLHDRPLFADEYNSLTRAPGIRYFPNRPVLVPPAPVRNSKNSARALNFRRFYDRLEKEEPDRLVAEPIGA